MIITQDIFPVTYAKTTWSDSHMLGQQFDQELDQILDLVPNNKKLETLVGEYNTTLRVTNDIMQMESAKPFRYWIESTMQELWQAIGYEECQIAVERSWINKMGHGSSLKPHAHGSTEMVATYYHKAPPGSGKLVLYNPYELQTGMAPYARKSVVIEPKAGELYAWPGYLWHSVETHEAVEPRIAISMHIHQGSHTLTNRWIKVS